jgi:hypothetical protein
MTTLKTEETVSGRIDELETEVCELKQQLIQVEEEKKKEVKKNEGFEDEI